MSDLVDRLREPCFERGLDELWIDAQRQEAADRITKLEAHRDELLVALKLADNNLTNLQPKIANGLVIKDWVPVFDSYIDPVIDIAREAISKCEAKP